MTVILIILAILIAIGGVFSLSNATMGVGIVGIACLFACFGRIAQASKQHSELQQLIEQMGEQQKIESISELKEVVANEDVA